MKILFFCQLCFFCLFFAHITNMNDCLLIVQKLMRLIIEAYIVPDKDKQLQPHSKLSNQSTTTMRSSNSDSNKNIELCESSEHFVTSPKLTTSSDDNVSHAKVNLNKMQLRHGERKNRRLVKNSYSLDHTNFLPDHNTSFFLQGESYDMVIS